MDRPLITVTVFVSAILFGYSPLLVDSLGPEKSRSNQFAPPPASTSSTSSRAASPPQQAATRDTGNNNHSHSPPPLPKTSGSHFPQGPPGDHRLPRPNGKETTGKSKVNIGKKIGLLFAGIAGFLQVGVVLFLGIKRWQIMKMDRNS